MRFFSGKLFWLFVYLTLVLAPLVMLLIGEHPGGNGFRLDLSIAPGLRWQMEASWAHTFCHEVFVRIPDEPFAILYKVTTVGPRGKFEEVTPRFDG